jgi:hypothetical protein
MVMTLEKRMLVARLKGAEKRANTRPSMMKSMRFEQITCVRIVTNGSSNSGVGVEVQAAQKTGESSAAAAAVSGRVGHRLPLPG